MTTRRFERTQNLIGAEALNKIRRSGVIVFGLGGVGSYAAEALTRAGIGRLAFVDGDVVDETNINRQLIADYSSIGKPKAEVMLDRARLIAPDADITAINAVYSAENAANFDVGAYDFVVDAIDSVASKLTLIEQAKALGVSIISCMGAGNKLDPTRFRVCDISETRVCPLARIMRHELRKRGIDSLTVVYSDEPPIKPLNGERAPASISYVPSVAGLLMAAHVVNEIITPRV